MLRPDIVDFIENGNSQLMQLTRFKILEFKRLSPLLCSARFWGQPDEISFFSLFLVFSFAYMNNLQFEIFEKQNIFLYFNNRSDTYKLYPRYLLADVLTMCTTARQKAVYELGFSSLESCSFPSLVFIWLMT